jgi:hypothetical protein
MGFIRPTIGTRREQSQRMAEKLVCLALRERHHPDLSRYHNMDVMAYNSTDGFMSRL